MRKSLLIATLMLVLAACAPTKKDEGKTETAVIAKTSETPLYKTIEEMVWAEIKDPEIGRTKEDIAQFKRVETDSMITIGRGLDRTYYIQKYEYFKSDFDEDGTEDTLIPVIEEFGASSATTFYYLFLNKGGKITFIEKYDAYKMATDNITNKDVISCGWFNFNGLSGSLLVGSGVYYGYNDAHCCPSYFIEKLKFKFNPKNNEFEQVYQSKLEHTEQTE